MFKKFVSVAAAAALVVSVSTAAWSAGPVAQIVSANGKVLVGQGKGFVPADGFMSLNVGDKVMVGAKSSAEIAYNKGCVVTLSAGSVVTVPEKAPCGKGETAAMVDSVVVEPVMGGGYGGSPLVLGGIAVVVGTIILVTVINKKKKKNSASAI